MKFTLGDIESLKLNKFLLNRDLELAHFSDEKAELAHRVGNKKMSDKDKKILLELMQVHFFNFLKPRDLFLCDI